MPDPVPDTEPISNSRDEYARIMRDVMKSLELEKLHLENESRATPVLASLDNELIKTLTEWITLFAKSAQEEPERTFELAMSSLHVAEAKRFLIENVLEAMKRGEELGKVFVRYADLGLLPAAQNVTEGMSATGTGEALTKRKNRWARVMTWLAQAAVGAVKSIPKLVGTEVQLSFVLGIPVVTFSLKGKMTGDDLIQMIAPPASAKKK